MRGLFRGLLVLTVVFSLTLALLMPLAGCGKKEPTPGEALDSAIEQTDEAAEEVSEAAEEAAEAVGEAAEEAAEDAEEAME